MAKPTTGRIVPKGAPEPDPDQMATDTLMTSVFSGVCLVVATVYFATFGWVGLELGTGIADETGAKVGLGVGLAVGLVVMVWALRRFAGRIRGRSNNLYRGIWIGGLAALGIIVVMAYLPHVVFPQYCPPGAICENGQR
jgi:hypothetical protein